MYVVKKCEAYSYGKNKWDVIFTSPDRAGAVAILKAEFRLILEADPSLDRKQIEDRVNHYMLDDTYTYYRDRRCEVSHGMVAFSLMKSQAAEHTVPAERPDRTALLDSILS